MVGSGESSSDVHVTTTATCASTMFRSTNPFEKNLHLSRKVPSRNACRIRLNSHCSAPAGLVSSPINRRDEIAADKSDISSSMIARRHGRTCTLFVQPQW